MEAQTAHSIIRPGSLMRAQEACARALNELEGGSLTRAIALLQQSLAELRPTQRRSVSLPIADAPLRLHANALWMERNGKRFEIGRSRTLRRVLLYLIEQHQKAPGRSTAVEALFSVGWPDERATPASAANRVYVTLSRLRAAGLRDALRACDGGWYLDPHLIIQHVARENEAA